MLLRDAVAVVAAVAFGAFGAVANAWTHPRTMPNRRRSMAAHSTREAPRAKYALGVDVGTGSARAGVFDLEGKVNAAATTITITTAAFAIAILIPAPTNTTYLLS